MCEISPPPALLTPCGKLRHMPCVHMLLAVHLCAAVCGILGSLPACVCVRFMCVYVAVLSTGQVSQGTCFV